MIAPTSNSSFIRPTLFSVGFFLCLSVFTVAGCTDSSTELSNRTLVRVNGDEIKAQAFSQDLMRELKEFDALTVKDQAAIKRAKDNVVQNFIVRVLTEEYARDNNLLVRKEELDGEINAVRSQYPDDISFRKMLNDEELTFSQWKEKMKFSILQRLVAAHIRGARIEPPSDEELKAFYENNKDLFKTKERVRIRQVFLNSENDAQRIIDELKSGKKMQELAEKFSVAPEAENGGDIGWIEKGTLDIFDKAFDMRIGQRSPMVKSPYGFHIFEVIDKEKGKTQSFSDVKESIRKQILEKREQGAYSEWLEDRLAKAKVFKDEKFISRLKVETRSQ